MTRVLKNYDLSHFIGTALEKIVQNGICSHKIEG